MDRLLRVAHVRAATLLIAGAAACGGDSAGPLPPGNVAAVVITGAPGTTLLVGDSVRLIATAVNESGGVVSDQRITWTSSAPTVAAVRPNGTVIALGAGTTTITASTSGQEGSVALDVAFGVTVGTQGGQLTAASGAFKLSIPPSALSQSTLLLVHPANNPPADTRLVSGTAFELGPDGVSFARAATLTLVYDPVRIPSGLAGESLQLYAQSGTAWTAVPGSKVDLTAKTVTGSIYRAGVYVVRSTPVDRITLSGSAAGGALYTGQSSSLHASLFGETGDSLPSRPLTWSSSDQSKVTVDADGKVTGVAQGSATITASTEGKSATTTVTILSRPTADWSRATDWSTYQADSRHSGYVDASVDPTVFREKWVATPVAAANYYQPTIGGGRVYLSMNAYFSAQQVIALDLADGSKKWVRDFGAIFGINQSTYDNGTLYVTSGGHEDTYLWALGAADGTLIYQKPFDSQWEHWKAPVIAGSQILTAGGYYGGMYGFDRLTGQQAFFMSGPQVDGWGPAILNGLAYTTGYVSGGGVRAVNPADGTIAFEIVDSRLTGVTTPVGGETNDVLTITGNRLVSVDLASKTVAWEQSGTYTGMPVVGNGVVYGFSGTTVAARRESDGSLLWSWTPPTPYTAFQSLALVHNVLFASVGGGYGTPGATFAIDLASHLAVWSYPMNGDLALGSQGVLVIVQGQKVAAISLR